MNKTLSKHLTETDRTATEKINRIVKVMAEQDNTIKRNKSTFVGWFDNNYKLSAEKIVYNEIIFS